MDVDEKNVINIIVTNSGVATLLWVISWPVEAMCSGVRGCHPNMNQRILSVAKRDVVEIFPILKMGRRLQWHRKMVVNIGCGHHTQRVQHAFDAACSIARFKPNMPQGNPGHLHRTFKWPIHDFHVLVFQEIHRGSGFVGQSNILDQGK